MCFVSLGGRQDVPRPSFSKILAPTIQFWRQRERNFWRQASRILPFQNQCQVDISVSKVRVRKIWVLKSSYVPFKCAGPRPEVFNLWRQKCRCVAAYIVVSRQINNNTDTDTDTNTINTDTPPITPG